MTLLYSRGRISGWGRVFCEVRINESAGSTGHTLGVERQRDKCTRAFSADACGKRIVVRIGEARGGGSVARVV